MGKVCFLCKSSVDDEVQYGKFYTKWKLSVHYYCLLLSSNLIQNGADDTVGIFGFLEQDIRKENERTKRYRCFACKENHANVSCCFKKCLRVFHTECGFKNGCLSHYTGTYQSWCPLHIPLKKERKPHGPEDSCAICFDAMGAYDRIESVRAPCCQNGWFHLRCVRQLALAAGYFLKCPLCNNVDEFTKAMPLRGVFVPERDAAWELEPNAFQEQLERPSECDAERCRCSDGRTVDNRAWSLLICGCCGSTSRHRECMEEPDSRVYVCQQCKPIMGDRVPEPEEDDDDDKDSSSDTYASCESSREGEEDEEEEETVAVKRMDPASAGSESGVQCSSSEESLQPIRLRKRKPNQARIASDSDTAPSEASSESLRRSTRRTVRRRAIKRLLSDESEPTATHPEQQQSTVLETTKRTKGKRQRQTSAKPIVQQDDCSNSSGTSSLSNCPRRKRRSLRQSKRKAMNAMDEHLHLSKLLSDTESVTRDSSPAGSTDWCPSRTTTGASKKRRTDAEKTIGKRRLTIASSSSSDSDSSLPILPAAKRRRGAEVASKTGERGSLRTVNSSVSDGGADEENINPQLGSPVDAAGPTPPSPPSVPETVKQACTSDASVQGSSNLNRSGGEVHQSSILNYFHGHSSSKTIPDACAGTSAGKDHSRASKLRSPTERTSHKKQIPTGQRDLLKYFNRC
ncbi:pineapple eye protein-like [Anopheles aquasalis]|uniref:pineapple eye protein-like n=1 Tax=Anopheles aquasalis TaxID=42839 RepID=UPI00215AD273|nr:pineapple eye protein-like [Anopheles aquasalis]